MEDKKYFINYKKNFEAIFLESDELVYLKNSEFKYQAITHNMLKLMGLTSEKQVINFTNDKLQLSGTLSELVPQFNKQDEQIKKSRKRDIFLDILPHPEDMQLYVVYKTPIFNPHTDNFVGIRVQLTPLILPHMLKLLFKVHGTKGLLLTQESNINVFKEYQLTPMQHIVLFLCLNNHSYTEISLLMSEFVQNVSPTQVNSYLEELKLIFHVRTKTQLIEKAIGLNFHSYLPYKLFKLNSISLNNEVASLVDISKFKKDDLGTIANRL